MRKKLFGAGLVRQRHEREDGGRVRVDPPLRNRIVGERQTGERVLDGRGEDAGAIVGRRHARQARDAARDPRPLVVGKEERLALHDGPAKISAVLILIVGRLGRVRPNRKEVAGVERIVAEVFVRGAVEIVGAGLGGDADRRTRRAPVLGRIRARDDLEFLNRIHRRPRHLGRQLLDVLRDAVVVHAVEQEVVLQRPRAVDVDAAGAAERRAATLLGVPVTLHARHERQQVVPVALVTATVAPGRTPPLESLTIPLSVARSTCAIAFEIGRKSRATRASMPRSVRVMKKPSRRLMSGRIVIGGCNKRMSGGQRVSVSGHPKRAARALAARAQKLKKRSRSMPARSTLRNNANPVSACASEKVARRRRMREREYSTVASSYAS